MLDAGRTCVASQVDRMSQGADIHRENGAEMELTQIGAGLRAPLDQTLEGMLGRLGAGRRRVRRGDYLIHYGESVRALYVVRAGSFKSMLLTEDGREQVIGYHMACEVLGLENFGRVQCAGDTVALEDSEVMEAPLADLHALAVREPDLYRQLLRLMADEIHRERSLILLLGSMRAEERLATFLVNLSRRLAISGWSPTHFILRMTREEIGSLLGLKLETVSRTLSRFQTEGLIMVRSREISILDMSGLKLVVGRTT